MSKINHWPSDVCIVICVFAGMDCHKTDFIQFFKKNGVFLFVMVNFCSVFIFLTVVKYLSMCACLS